MTGRKNHSFLPIKQDIETREVLRKTTGAPSAQAELKGVVISIAKENILIETLALTEARESSAIENIISTLAGVYQSSLFTEEFLTSAAKDIH